MSKAYVFWIQKDVASNGTELRNLYRREVQFSEPDERLASLSAVVAKVLESSDFVIVQNEETFPDTKNIFMQNEMFNVAAKTSHFIREMRSDINELKSKLGLEERPPLDEEGTTEEHSSDTSASDTSAVSA